jgi:molybdopterin-guanine dinucleotide biosynthesis protein A
MTDTHANRSAVPAYILAGGNSRRFGSDKARATLHGRPLILALSNQLVELGFKITVVGKQDGQYADLGLDTIGDIEPDGGPIGGLWTALTHQRTGWILLCSCDMLGIDESWILALIDRQQREPDAAAVVAKDDIWQPFPALYHTQLLTRPAARDARSFQSLLSKVPVAAMRPDGLPPVRQANTQDQLREAEGGTR